MWHVVTEEDVRRSKEAAMRLYMEAVERERKKAEARRRHQETTKCEHCGRTDPIPPWLQ